jgi:hypothetical protein
MGVNENCVDKIMDFLENTLKIEDTKSIQIEKAYRLGKRKDVLLFYQVLSIQSLRWKVFDKFLSIQNLSLVTWAVVADKGGEGVSGKQVNNLLISHI